MKTPALLFVTGSRKSGTTWLRNLLDQHPNITCANEAMFHAAGRSLVRAFGEYNKNLQVKAPIFGEETVPPLGKDEFRSLFRNLVIERLQREAARRAPDKDLMYLGEKDPAHVNEFNVMMDCFPEARFIHIIRDGRDVAVSWWYHMLRYGDRANGQGECHFSQIAMRQARIWSRDICEARKHQAVAGAPYHELRYESLLDAPEETLAAVLQFLDVPRTSEIITQCVEDASFAKLSGGRQAGEEDRASFYRKGVKGDWRSHMDDELSRAFIRESHGLMQELGYA